MIKEKEYLNKIDMIKLDNEKELIPLSFDSMFKKVFTNDLELLKKFILLQISELIDPDDCTITLLNNELNKDKNKEKKNTLDIYVTVNDNIFVDIEVNTERFKDIEGRNILFLNKLHTLIFKSGTNYKTINDTKIIQLNINANELDNKIGSDIIVYYGLYTKKQYQDNKYIVLKNIEYYRNLYYNEDANLSESELWLVMLSSKSFIELYNITSKIFTKEEQNRVLRSVIDMCLDDFSIHEWEKEKMDKYVELTKLSNAREEGKADGFELGKANGKNEGIRENSVRVTKSMLEKDMDINLISEITNLSVEEIIEIKKSL